MPCFAGAQPKLCNVSDVDTDTGVDAYVDAVADNMSSVFNGAV